MEQPLSVAERFAQAFALHQQGRLADAARGYAEILKVQPAHFDALHLSGVIAQQQGDHVRAAELVSRAIGLNPGVAAAHINLGLALHGLRQYAAAVASYERAATLEPDNGDVYFNRGNALREQGRLEEAIASYTVAIRANPRDAQAWNNRGATSRQLGRPDDALRDYDEAIALDPSYAQAHNNRGVVLKEQKRPQEAVQAFDRAIAIRPDYADAFSNRGNALKDLRRWGEALESFDRAIAIKPDHAEAFFNRGNAMREMGRIDEALKSLDESIRIRQSYAQAFNNRGNALLQLDRPGEALASFDEAVRLDGTYADALNNRGWLLMQLNQPDAAIQDFERAIHARSGFAQAHFNRGNALAKLRRFEAALESFDRALELQRSPEALTQRGNALLELRQFERALENFDEAIALHPEFADAHASRGNALHSLKRREEALESYELAIKLQPGKPEPHYNRANALTELRRFDAALESYDRAAAFDPYAAQPERHAGRVDGVGFADVYLNKSLALLTCGHLAEGFKFYEWRWGAFGKPQRRELPQPVWLGGESLRGKTILLHAEQGLGDTVQFCRYVPMVAALGARVVLEIPPALRPLMQSVEGVSELVAWGEPLPAFDVHCPLLSLPLAFATTLDTIPSPGPYLRADSAAVGSWSERLGPRSRTRVGLVWSGNPAHGNDANRSIALATMLAGLPPGFDYFSLQKDVRDSDRAALERASGVSRVGEAFGDFGDTAAVCSLMDVVVTADTSVAHVAAALGKPTWILLPYVPDWRWMLDREDSPWYLSARLFRQPEDRQWAPVMQRVADSLREFDRARAVK